MTFLDRCPPAGERQTQPEHRPSRRGLELQRPAHRLRQLSRDRQPEPAPDARGPRRGRTARRRCAGILGRNAGAVVLHLEHAASHRAPDTRVPAGVCTSAFSTSARPICRTRCSSPVTHAPSEASSSSGRPPAADSAVNSSTTVSADLREIDRLAAHLQPPRVDPREVEQLGRQLGQPVDLLAHRREELSARRLVELLVAQQLEEAAEGEHRRAQLVRRVGDELAAGVVELGEPKAHPVERSRELADLVRSGIGDRLVEPPRGDLLRSGLQPPQPAREQPRAPHTRPPARPRERARRPAGAARGRPARSPRPRAATRRRSTTEADPGTGAAASANRSPSCVVVPVRRRGARPPAARSGRAGRRSSGNPASRRRPRARVGGPTVSYTTTRAFALADAASTKSGHRNRSAGSSRAMPGAARASAETRASDEPALQRRDDDQVDERPALRRARPGGRARAARLPR